MKWDGHPDQYLPQNETFKLYQDLKFNKTQEAMEASFQRLPQTVFSNKNEGRNRFRGRFDNQTMASTMLANYYRLISGVDAACEKIWKELEAQGILDETMVIFSTDNGYVSVVNHRLRSCILSCACSNPSTNMTFDAQTYTSITESTDWLVNGILTKNPFVSHSLSMILECPLTNEVPRMIPLL